MEMALLAHTLFFSYPLHCIGKEAEEYMNEATSQSCCQLYASAIVELNRKQLLQRMDATEAAIQGRLRDLQYDSDHHEERQMMGDAQCNLAFLRRNP
jgi:hypothetical protein